MEKKRKLGKIKKRRKMKKVKKRGKKRKIGKKKEKVRGRERINKWNIYIYIYLYNKTEHKRWKKRERNT